MIGIDPPVGVLSFPVEKKRERAGSPRKRHVYCSRV